MKKMTLVLMVGVSASLGFFGCTPKMHENLMAKDRVATAPAPTVVNSSNLVPFSRLKMQQLQRNGIDPTQVQFYIDQKVILRRMSGSDRETVRKGEIVTENTHSANEVILPEFTPVVCDKAMGDTLMISFEAQNNDIPFVALYGGNTFTVLGTNWINGSADVTYDNQTYRIICGSCGNVAEVRLMVKETSVDKPTNAGKTVVGRKLYK